jgi:hypothetical protein
VSQTELAVRRGQVISRRGGSMHGEGGVPIKSEGEGVPACQARRIVRQVGEA